MAHNERRIELISAAQKLFYTKGYESTSVNDIINEVGVSKGAFYHYFESKQAILTAVVDLWAKQADEIVQTIVGDPALDAIAKFNHMMQTLNNWKIEQKDEMLNMARILHMDDNLRLLDQLRRTGAKAFVPMLGQIIEQGIIEGFFDTESPQEMAELVIVVMRASSEGILAILLSPEASEEPVQWVQRKIGAAQTAVERILGAPAGSLVMLDMEMVAAWFE